MQTSAHCPDNLQGKQLGYSISFLVLAILQFTHSILLQNVRRSVPYTEQRQVCSATQLWQVSTPVVYPWSPVTPLFVVRGDNLDYCADLEVDELTEEDLEICEVVCQPSKVEKCAKVGGSH